MALLLTRILALVLLCYQFTNAVGGLPKTQLIKAMSEDLLKNYSKHIVPSETEPFNVTVHVDLLSLGEIDELEEKLSSVFWMNFNWLDENINWDKNQTNASYITLSYNEVWTPIFRVGNPHADVSKSQSVDRSYDVVMYDSVGNAYYDEMMTTRTTCDLDMTYYPFDVQSCSIMLTLVGRTQFWFKLDVSMHEWFSDEDANHGSWRLLNTSVTAEHGVFFINLVFKRKPLFLLINILLPIIVLATLTPLVFVLPKKSGERVGYAITMLLAISVYMTIVSDNLPKNSEPMPLISIMIFIWYILDAVIVFVVIINTKINTIRDDVQLPCFARNFVIITQKATSLVTCQYCKKTDHGSSDEKEACIEMESKNKTEKDVDFSKSENHDSLDKVTWNDVSKSIDKWCFIISYLFKILLPIIFLTIAKSKSGFEE